ncbi:MAG: hypothetical protein ACFFDI_19275 [Promethearchaeota archaeon]
MFEILTYVGRGGVEPGSAIPKDNPKRKIVMNITNGIVLNVLNLFSLVFFSWKRNLFHNVIILQYYRNEDNMNVLKLEILMK